MAKTRIQLNDTVMAAVLKMADGNPGAISVLTQLLQKAPAIDKCAAMGGFMSLLMLDAEHIYGSSVWILYKDQCGEDIEKTLATLRASQLGYFREGELFGATQDRYPAPPKLNVDGALAFVKRELGNDWVSPPALG